MTTPESPFSHHFSILEDPRIERTKKHLLTDMIAIAVIAALCGIDDFKGIAIYAKARLGWLQGFLNLSGGAPSHDTFSRVFARIKPEAFQACFTAWMAEITTLTKGEVIAIDGKALRRSFDKASGKSAIHMVSAWATENGVCLGQIKVDDKSNEITAIPKLLETLCLKGCLVTLDAMGCQREVAQKIVDAEADYTISLKGNQGTLHVDVQRVFEQALLIPANPLIEMRETKEKGHGREERRRYFTLDAPPELLAKHGWPGLLSIGLMKSTRIIGGKASYADNYYISSYAKDVGKFSHAARSHWAVENSLHWVLDVTYGDDASRVRKDHGAQNLSTVRRIAINMLKREPKKESIRAKHLLCTLDQEYLLKALTS